MNEKRNDSNYDDIRYDTDENDTKALGTGIRIGAYIGIVAALLGIVAALWYFLFRPSTLTLAMELKLDVYNAIDSTISDAICAQDDKAVSDWAINIVDKTLAKDRLSVKDLDRDNVVKNVERNIKTVLSAGNIEKNGDELTDLSKSYVANAVANAVSYSMPEADFDATVDTGNTSYRQVLDMQETLNHLKLQNESLTNIVGDMNKMMNLLGVDNNLGVTQDEVQSKLDALQTQMAASSYTDKNKQVTESDKDNSKVNLINTTVNMDDSQEDIIKKLQDALARIQELSDEIDKLRNNSTTDGSTSSNDSTASLKDTIATLQKQIEELKESLKTTNDTICKDITSKDTEYKESITRIEKLLESKVTELQTALQTASEDERKNLQDKVDELNKLIEKNKKDSDDEDKKLSEKVDKDVKDLSDKTDKSVKDLSDKTDKSVKDLTDKTNKDIKDLSDKTDKSVKDLTDKTDKDIKELSDKTAEAIKTLSDETSNSIKDLADSTAKGIKDLSDEIESRLNQQMEETQKKFDDVNNTIEKLRGDMNDLKTELQNEISGLDSRLTSKIDANSDSIRELQKRLERYMVANDGHSKIDVIPGFVISEGSGEYAWSVDDAVATCTITSEFFKDATLVDVDYSDGYDITPEYSINTMDGTLVISIPADQAADIGINEIVVYHTVTDDKPDSSESSGSDTTEDTEKPEDNGETENPEDTEKPEEIKANGNEGGDEYSSLSQSSEE